LSQWRHPKSRKKKPDIAQCRCQGFAPLLYSKLHKPAAALASLPGSAPQPAGSKPSRVDGPSFERAGAVSHSEAREPLSEHRQPCSHPRISCSQKAPGQRPHSKVLNQGARYLDSWTEREFSWLAMRASPPEPVCPICRRPMRLELQPSGKLPRTFHCLNCDQPDPMKSASVSGLINALRPPE
jgi:hypothetical protein